MKKYLFIFALLILGGVVVASRQWASLQVVQAQNPPAPLFAPLESGGQRVASHGREVIRARFVDVQLDLLSPLAEQLYVNPFADLGWTAVRDNIEQNPLFPNSFSWQGHLEGVPLSQATFTVHEGIVVGKIAMPGGVYELRHTAGATEIVQLNQTAFVDHGEPPIGVESSAGTAASRALQAPQSVADDGSLIDIMVVYTPQARVGAGGTAAIEATIQLAVAETNQGYANSGVQQQLFLVHVAEVAYDETTDGEIDLGRLRATNDGFMDEVHTWRDTYHADFVALIVEQMIYQEVPVCGLGYRPNVLEDADFQLSAFSLTARVCAVGNYTFGHEVGHNMGLNHDWYADGPRPPAPQAHAYAHPSANPAERWRTVMAYNNLCAATHGSCPRLLYFSNPEETLTGDPMGVPAGTADNCVAGELIPNPQGCDADNRSVLNTNALTNAQFRRSAITWTGAVSTAWDEVGNWEMEEGPYYDRVTVNRLPRAIDDVVIPANPTDGRFPILESGTAVVRHLHILAGGQLTLEGGTLTVEGDVTNAGTLIQTQDVAESSTVSFGRLQNQAGTQTKYEGMQISNTAGDWGSTTIAIAGMQHCGLGSGNFALRCYTITPTTPSAADIHFYFSEAERNDRPANSVPAVRWDGLEWINASSTNQLDHSETGTNCTTNDGLGCWVQAMAVNQFGHPFTLGTETNVTPTPTPTLPPEDAYLPMVIKPLPTPTPTPSPTPSPTPPANTFDEQVVALVNQERAAVGCNPLTMHPILHQVALAHSQDMAHNDYFSHTGLNGSTPWERMEAAGYNWTRAGENIAAGYSSPSAVMQGWMNSPGHRANILNCNFEDIGVGYYFYANDTGTVNYFRYWTQVFGSQ